MRIFLHIAAVLFVMVFYNADASGGSFTDNGDGTVTDNDTGLMWQKEDDGVTKTWESAICEGLSLGGYTDWRLPNIKELESITDDTKNSPAIDSTYFTNTNSSDYWSSTTTAENTSSAWHVNFYSGSVNSSYKSGGYYVRCVRGGQ
jgi:hypothetical protein